MPDLDIVPAFTCKSNIYWTTLVKGSKGAVYQVSWTFAPGPDYPHQYGWDCDCPAFKYRGGQTCKHIKQVQDKRCAWNAELEPTAKPDKIGTEFCCPDCRGPVEAMRVGV